MSEPMPFSACQPARARAADQARLPQLAMQWHPDRNPDPAAAEQFRRLRDAHDRLLAALLGDEADPARGRAPPHRKAWRGPLADTGDQHRGELHRGAARRSRSSAAALRAVLRRQRHGELSVSRLCSPCRGSGRARACRAWSAVRTARVAATATPVPAAAVAAAASNCTPAPRGAHPARGGG